jgi:predicted aconitase with swiveling domain
VKTFRQEQIYEDTIDAKTGQIIGNATVSSLNGLHKEDQSNLIALQSVRQELADAVVVAENNTSGKALSGGVMSEAGKLIFVIVVLSGTNLKQVMLEPPSANNLATLPRRSKQH